METPIRKENIQRLIRDVKQIMKEPLTEHGIYYTHDDTDILKGYAMIVGPEDTQYFGGYYFFKFLFPSEYPYKPPELLFCTNNGITRFNPNFYVCGKVCVSILNTWNGDKWTSCQTISTILLALCSLLNNTPLLNEPGQTQLSPDYNNYNRSIEFVNIDFAICSIIKGNLSCSEFKVFYPFMIEHFFKNYEKIYNFIKEKSETVDNTTIAVIIYPRMITTINYKKLLNTFIETKEYVLYLKNNILNNDVSAKDTDTK